jgi:site-specific DNA recombinase
VSHPIKRPVRCAIYTRKSSEEGLEQSFNSLDAQPEACQAYIQSQRQEGLRALETRYDDGGYSGGSMERPGLKLMLADIEARKIDTVVVYKVDRLTRSLADFAKIIEVFDGSGVSFVSVTQQFNTTSSMGRLTLNVLLSFAQFEREVTGERIRDKIAASKQQGIWMGGPVPLGYDLGNRRLDVNQKEAEVVREIYRLYLRLGCVRQLKADLEKRGARSKIRVGPAGRRTGGGPISRGALYKILRNELYVGEVHHKGQSYPGEHDAIVDRELWEKVQAMMTGNARARRYRTNAKAPSLLCGMVYDDEGNRFTPSHAAKNGKRYRYYVSQKLIKDRSAKPHQAGRIPARELEKVVIAELTNFFTSADRIVTALTFGDDELTTIQAIVGSAAGYAKRLDGSSPDITAEILASVVARVVVHQDSVYVQLSKDLIPERLLEPDRNIRPGRPTNSDSDVDPIILTIPAKLKQCGHELRMIIPSRSGGPEPGRTVPSLLKALSRAHEWIRLIEEGKCKDQKAVTLATGLPLRYIRGILRTAFVAPTIVEAIVEGRQRRI